MKSLHKLTAIILVLAFLLPGALAVNASGYTYPLTQAERAMLIDVLADIEPQKDVWGLGDVDFCDMEIGTPIQTYEYVDHALISSRVMYPLIANDRLVLWAIPHNGQFQVGQGLIEEINEAVSLSTAFALIYDAESVYLYANGTCQFLANSGTRTDSRSVITSDTVFPNDRIVTAALSEKATLGFFSKIPSTAQRIPTYYSCDVRFVSQLSPQIHNGSLMCWAASVACIVNYVYGLSGCSSCTGCSLCSNCTYCYDGTYRICCSDCPYCSGCFGCEDCEYDVSNSCYSDCSNCTDRSLCSCEGYTAIRIAKEVHGEYNFNQFVNDYYVRFVLSDYNIQYAYTGNNLASNIHSSIMADYPVIGSFSSSISSEGHAAVIYGSNLISGYINVMDPECGAVYIPTTNGKHIYTSPYSTAELELYAITYYNG